MLAQRLRRWPNIETSLFQRSVFAGNNPLYLLYVITQGDPILSMSIFYTPK